MEELQSSASDSAILLNYVQFHCENFIGEILAEVWNNGSWYHQIVEINRIRINQKIKEANIHDKGAKWGIEKYLYR